MISIIGYSTTIENGKKSKTVRHLDKKWFAEDLPSLFGNLEEWITKNVPVEERYNLHYTIGHTKDRKSRKYEYVEAVCFDVDHVDYTRYHDYVSAMEKIVGLPPQATIVSSGHGLHFIIHLDYKLTPEEYAEMRHPYVLLCKKAQAELKSRNLPGTVDNMIFRDSGTLRLPLTANVKPDEDTTQCVISRERWEPVKWSIFDYVLDKCNEESVVEAKELKSYPKAHNEGVLTCPFLLWCKKNQDQVVEPQWYAMISILSRLEDGEELCHEYSKQHRGYNEHETDTKIEQALSTSGPRTCANISTLWDGCASCTIENIISPINIVGKNFIKTQDTGFHTMKYVKVLDERGEPVTKKTVGKPCKEDLAMFFEQQYSYKTVAEGKSVYIYENLKWRLLHDTYIEAFAQEHYVPSPCSSDVSEFLKMIHRTNIVHSDWFNPSGLLNLRNGVLDMSTMEMSPHSKEFGFTYVMDYDYVEGAMCPIFDRFLATITLADQNIQNVLLEYMAYCLSNMDCDLDKALILTGEGSNGKSTLLDIFSSLVGVDNYSAIPAAEMGVDTKRILMKDKLFNIADETPKKAFLDNSTFKSLVSGGEQTGRFLYKQACTYKNKTKLIFTCNELPISSDSTYGMFRRLIIVPFNKIFSEEERDVRIGYKMEAEKSGILNRIIVAYKRLVENSNFTRSTLIETAINEYKKDTDTPYKWYTERILETDNEEEFISIKEMYTDYVSFCDSYRMYVQAFSPFTKRIKAVVGKETRQLGGRDNRARGYTNMKLEGEY